MHGQFPCRSDRCSVSQTDRIWRCITGGVVHEPLGDMVRVLASMTEHEKVRLPGFYNNVRPLEPFEKSLYDEIIRRCKL